MTQNSYTSHPGQRVSTIHKFQASHLHVDTDIAIFTINALLKHDKPGRKREHVYFYRFPHNENLCPVKLILDYKNRISNLNINTNDGFFVTIGKPHRTPSKDTIARWIKETLEMSGIDTQAFKPHSCRSASSSKARANRVPIETILKSGNWKSKDVFHKFYEKQIEHNKDASTLDFAHKILTC